MTGPDPAQTVIFSARTLTSRRLRRGIARQSLSRLPPARSANAPHPQPYAQGLRLCTKSLSQGARSESHSLGLSFHINPMTHSRQLSLKTLTFPFISPKIGGVNEQKLTPALLLTAGGPAQEE